MRLTCSNCEAQYEVDGAVIPDDGRDVQCSNCGHTWLQLPEGATATDTEDRAPLALATPAAAAGEPRRRTLDEAVLDVLREEAEREAEARRAEGSSLETQADLGLEAAPPAAPPPSAPVPPPVDMDESHEADAVVTRAARRELLPDIEEINSTLRPATERGEDAAAQDAPQVLRQRRSAFRRGFLSSLTLAGVLLALYLGSGAISARVPALAPALSGYAQAVDGGAGLAGPADALDNPVAAGPVERLTFAADLAPVPPPSCRG